MKPVRNRLSWDPFRLTIRAGAVIALLAGPVAYAAALEPMPYSPGSGPPRKVPASREVLWSQPADLSDAKVSSEIISQFGLESEVADDFILNVGGVVTNVISWGGYYNWTQGDPPITGLNLRFLTHGNCAPDTVVDEYALTPLNEQFIGYDGYGYPTYRYETPVTFVARPGVHYWLVVQATDHVFPPQWGRQGPGWDHWIQLCSAVFRSEYFGYPDWEGLCDFIMEPCDTSFELQGVAGGAGEACCFGGAICILMEQNDCARLGGAPQGEGSVCNPNPCAPDAEACCFADGSCRLLIAADCGEAGGQPLGPGTDCTPNPCPNQVQACCFADGSCEMSQPDACIEQGGSPGGPGEDCDPNRCDEPHACCFELGSCRILSPAACLEAGGSALGAGADCSPNPCFPHSVERACCLDDNRCIVAPVIDCIAEGGDPLLPGTPCEPDPCTPDPTPRACCFGDGTCILLLADACTGQGGLTLGACTTCDPNPCTGVAIQRASWGRIKALFRGAPAGEEREVRP